MVSDGLGWYLEYVGRLLKYYPGFSLDYINYELSMDMGWALLNWGLENDAWLQFAGMKRSGKGYIGLEVDILEKQYYDKYGRKT